MRKFIIHLIPLILLLFLQGLAHGNQSAATVGNPTLNLNITGGENPEDLGIAIQLVIFMTLLTLAPSIIMLMTSFTRMVIVLGFVRSAIGIQSAPSNQIVIGLALFLTFFIMTPVWEKVYEKALVPYMDKEITSKQALSVTGGYMKTFMLKQTREKDIEFFLGLAGSSGSQEELPMRIVIPSFILSELRTAFQMGFMIFVPFLIIDFLVASTLMSMGMMMMPPAIISLPFKVLLFVLVDGWYLLVRSLVESFSL